MYKQILNSTQLEILPKLKSFSPNFYLVGGTALALQLGHRSSIDFDLFTPLPFDHQAILNTLKSFSTIERIMIDNKDELTLLISGVKFTFYTYPYPITPTIFLEDIIFMPDELTIAAMKAYALGRRAKWKDYVDLYFILQKYSFNDLLKQSELIYKAEFDEKLFREQLAYHQDIDFSEKVIFLPQCSVEDSKIKEFLLNISLS